MEAEVICCCELHQKLQDLEESGTDDALLFKLVERCAEKGDEYSQFLKARFIAANSEVQDLGEYLEAMKSLVERGNHWAMAELGLYYTFDAQEYELGKHYLFLGALFGEARAQFYYGYSLEQKNRNDPLAKRLLESSAGQGYERADTHLKGVTG